MARPKIVHLKHGRVELKGFPKEIQDKLVAHIQAFESIPEAPQVLICTNINEADQPPVEVVGVVPPAPQYGFAPDKVVTDDVVNMSEKALGVHKVGSNFIITTLHYNPESGVALVQKKETVGHFRRDAVVNFKLAATELGFV